MAIYEVMTRGKNIYYQKMMGSCVSEGVEAIRRELLKARRFLDMIALHNEAMIAEEEAL